MKNRIYIATTTDKLETVVDFADTLKELCKKLDLNYSNCKSNLNQIFTVRKLPDIKKIYIKRVNFEDDE